MKAKLEHHGQGAPKPRSVFVLLVPYRVTIFFLIILGIVANSLTLFVPKLLQNGIDSYTSGTFNLEKNILLFCLVAFSVFVFTYLQSIARLSPL